MIVRNADTATNGTLAVTGCYFGGVPATTPMLLVQRGAKGAANDDSDSSRDRIIFGAGQGGFADEAYYRQ
ncbi:hypothetical protein [Lacticaseibacillus thailandensis]|uniref:Uncharacterized protein n=1 Tax=Lacticaseibacillus thailandensis DSM 22698 = JCM 13996 TaxID=1423810 RepID=A0A0R2C5T1_9LACO|nr:hypothetical protein [Lacticaseibacillus thailandensis]KRM87006.1 hypothetical protein FD19_GL001590 [Lacticaseibacillus thailandensis DSM 22698 = JCM 13996]